MVTQQMVDQLRGFEGRDFPVLSLYLGLQPGVRELRSVSARIKDLVQIARKEGESLPRPQAMSLREDVKSVLGMASRVSAELGHGVAIFASHGNDFLQYTSLPLRVRDRAVVDEMPYIRPLDAVLEESKRYCAVVLDRRRAEIFRFYMGELKAWEQRKDEEVRKSNFGGFSGYDERRVRTHATEVASRHFRDTATRLFELEKAGAFDLLLVGGQHENVDGLLAALHPDVSALVAGTFAVDTHTSTPPLVLEHCRTVAAAHDLTVKQEFVDGVIDTAKGSGMAVIGVDETVHAANMNAVDHLAIEALFSSPGFRCVACGWISGQESEGCPACGQPQRMVPDLADAVAIAVRAAGGEVQHVIGETALAPYQMGALTRFPLATS